MKISTFKNVQFNMLITFIHGLLFELVFPHEKTSTRDVRGLAAMEPMGLRVFVHLNTAPTVGAWRGGQDESALL